MPPQTTKPFLLDDLEDVERRVRGYDHSLTRGDNARIAPTHFENWLSRSTAQR
jgi:hypothetical protein